MKPKTTLFTIAAVLALIPAEIFIVIKIMGDKVAALQATDDELRAKYLELDAACRAAAQYRVVNGNRPQETITLAPADEGAVTIALPPHADSVWRGQYDKPKKEAWICHSDGDWVGKAYRVGSPEPGEGSPEHKQLLREFLRAFPQYHTTIKLE